MGIEAGEVPGTGRNHIIKRPRLTRLLDETDARIILLIAPAGYGKTTLAGEWLANRPHEWYRGNSASGDVAALALGLAKAVSKIVPGAGERLRARLRISRAPAKEIDELATLLADDLTEWPRTAWLGFDDYQFACDSEPVERFVERLVSNSALNLLAASRTRPRWATARRALYGEITEISRSLLTMNPGEAVSVLGAKHIPQAEGIFSLADGWPALIGLATFSLGSDVPGETIPGELYGFFAEELYQETEPNLQRVLRQFALAPYVTPDIAETIGGDDAERYIAAGLELGFFIPGRDRVELHPLLRTFLASKFRKSTDDPSGQLVSSLIRVLMERLEWDDAFELTIRFVEEGALIGLLEASLPDMLDQARLPTLERWLASAASKRLDAPIIHLAAAEVAFRQGKLAKAEALACHAAHCFKHDRRFLSRSHWIAGTSAHVLLREETALEHFRAADRSACSQKDASAAAWGQFIAADALEQAEEAQILLEHYAKVSADSVDELLRLGTGRLLMTAFFGDVQRTIAEQAQLVQLVDGAKDPVIGAAFLNVYARILVIAGQYEHAVDVAELQKNLATAHRLDFAIPFASLNAAGALWGLRDFRACRMALSRCEKLTSNNRVLTEANLFLARLHLANGRTPEALRALDEGQRVAQSLRSLFAEHLAWRSLAHAVAGDTRDATTLAGRAVALSRRMDVSGLIPWTEAILTTSKGGRRSAKTAFDAALDTGNTDAFVAAYRAHPRLLDVLSADAGVCDVLATMLERAHDYDLAKRIGVHLAAPRVPDGPIKLTRREREVLDLVSQGLTNKEIGRTLYITESTVKVHVRKICTKLGVRSRTEAATRAAEMSD